MNDKIDETECGEKVLKSLVDDEQQLNESFSIEKLLSMRHKDDSNSERYHSPSAKRKKKSKKHKSKKSKRKRRSKSPSRKKKKHRKHSKSRCKRSSRSPKACTARPTVIVPSVECDMEKVSDDDLPAGADFRSFNSEISSLNKVTTAKRFSPSLSNGKKREESFPLSKPRKRNESSDEEMKKPKSEVLNKMKNEKASSFMPRNVKLKFGMEKSKSKAVCYASSSSDLQKIAASPEETKNNDVLVKKRFVSSSDEEYGPKPINVPLEPLPISDDDNISAKSKSYDETDESPVYWEKRSKKTPDNFEERVDSLDDLSSLDRARSSSRQDCSSYSDRKFDRSSDNYSNSVDRNSSKSPDRRSSKSKSSKRRLRSVSSSSDSEKEWRRLMKNRTYSTAESFGRYDGRKRNTDYRRKTVTTVYVDKNYKVHTGERARRQKFLKYNDRGGFHSKDGDNAKDRDRDENKLVTTLRYSNRKRWLFRKFGFKRKRRISNHSLSRSRSRSRNGRASRSRSRDSKKHKRSDDSRSVDYKIDKKKLREIAQRNAQMMQSGFLPNAPPGTRTQLREGGQSVDQLVDFCQKLQQSEEIDILSVKEENSRSKLMLPKKRKVEEESDFIKHPYALKPSVPITFNIPNAVPLPVKTPAQRTLNDNQLRLNYPVSSGKQHREKISSLEENPFILPPPPKPPVLGSALHILPSLPPPPTPPVLSPSNSPATKPSDRSDDVITVFKDHVPAPLPAVGDLITKRIELTNRLEVNPNDLEASVKLEELTSQINAWAESAILPGKFTGNTGVSILTAEQLGPDNPKFAAWTKKDLFKNTKKIDDGVGMRLMQKMGWKQGEGLGKNRDGPLEPLLMDIKVDRKGLLAYGEDVCRSTIPAVMDKHPVSFLLEYCTKQHWLPPDFSCEESGPSNNRRFLWTVSVNGTQYKPKLSSNNKKTGKAQACLAALCSLGIIPNNEFFL